MNKKKEKNKKKRLINTQHFRLTIFGLFLNNTAYLISISLVFVSYKKKKKKKTSFIRKYNEPKRRHCTRTFVFPFKYATFFFFFFPQHYTLSECSARYLSRVFIVSFGGKAHRRAREASP
ncbi:hypothetical protein PUN28_008456 [Cardiocondyla obscurior]|uniref:Uncharacterized protein n=1 Tax=Cardiocondyla obscurior TaxID=286306 RepID=A0AAW2G0V1_9HYME